MGEPLAAQVETDLAEDVVVLPYSSGTTGFPKGVMLTNRNLVANIEQLARALRKLHSLPLTGRTFDASGAARDYVRRIPNPDLQKVKECVRIVEQGPRPPNLCFCHNDLVVGNIINVPETRFLDWEYACDNDPFFDLATVAAHHELVPAQRRVLLDAYFDGTGARWHEQLERQSQVYRALLYLWQRSRDA